MWKSSGVRHLITTQKTYTNNNTNIFKNVKIVFGIYNLWNIITMDKNY